MAILVASSAASAVVLAHLTGPVDVLDAAGLGPRGGAAGEGGSVPPDELQRDPVPAEPWPVVFPEVLTGSAVPVFGGEARVSDTVRIGEPGIRVAPDGTVYVHAPGVLWRSDDNGITWQEKDLGLTIICGCDSDVTVDSLGNVFYTDLALICTNVGMSPDKGDTWVALPSCLPIHDRQWIETNDLLHTYLTYRIGEAIYLNVAEASPVPVFVPLGRVNVAPSNFRAGYLTVDRGEDIAYLSYTSGNSVRVVVTKVGGVLGGAAGQITNQVLNMDRLVSTTGGTPNDSFSTIAVDNAGNVYVVWSERLVQGGATTTHIFMSASTDQGQTWSPKVKVDSVPTAVYPWPVAGDEGRLGIAYYGSQDLRAPGSVTGQWHVYYAFSDNAASGAATFTETKVIDRRVKTGPICTNGTGCSGGTRTFLDFMAVAMLADGRAIITYNDQEQRAQSDQPYIHTIVQVDGPLLVAEADDATLPAKVLREPRTVATLLR